MEIQPTKDFLDSLKKLKDELNELESKVQSVMSTVNDFTKVERALQQTKVGFLLAFYQIQVKLWLSTIKLVPIHTFIVVTNMCQWVPIGKDV